MKKLAIIGASYLQVPLINKAKEMGLETHVFAWAAGDEGERLADFFYPISIVEKQEILEKCIDIGIDGICSIASDLAMLTVNFVAQKMGLIGNGELCTKISTNKHLMRNAFFEGGDPSPQSIIVDASFDISTLNISLPVIVKPTDRSGSRGIFKVTDTKDLPAAINAAIEQSFEKKALIEEFAEGKEYSVEYISQNSHHNFLAVTEKFTSGAPHFIETGHLEPARISDATLLKIKEVTEHALSTLKIENGASHTELKIDELGNIRIIEIGGRMGGDCIGSDLVALSTGFDFVKAVIDVALGNKINVAPEERSAAAIRFIFSKKDLEVLNRLKAKNPEILIREDIEDKPFGEVSDSSSRFGYFLMADKNRDTLTEYLKF